jgi:multidrug resistance protein, MATE family
MTIISSSSLPAQRTDAHGHVQVDLRAIVALAVPLVANSSIQVALNLIDTWFVGRISTEALAGMGAIHWMALVFIGLLGGVGMAVQTLVAQAFGARRYARASQAAWTALWASLMTAPVFVLIAVSGPWLLSPFALNADVNALALQFWEPRMFGAALAVALWALLGFYNGIGRARVTLAVNLITLTVNAALAPLFIFTLHMGVAGAAWATNCATLLGVLIALWLFVRSSAFTTYRAKLTWRLQLHRLQQQFHLGFPMGLALAADLMGFSLFQLMQVKLGAVDGAASQIVMMLTSIAYMPAIGIALAGTTLVGQAIGAGNKEWARRLGNHVILLAVTYMGGIGLLLGISGRWLMPLFITVNDVNALAVIQTGTTLLWLAGAYQLFDGMNLSASFCLRGAGDAKVPAMLVLGLSWLLFVPLTHSLSFAKGQGWVNLLPQFGFGVTGGWSAAVIYICILGLLLLWRWRSNAWQQLNVR